MPDLVFFGGSWSSSPLRSEQFQADVMLSLMDKLAVPRFHCMGLSYGGFVAYRQGKHEGLDGWGPIMGIGPIR